MKHLLLWVISFFFFAFNKSEHGRFSRFDIAISFSNSTTKLSTSVFNLSVSNYCVDGLPNAFESRKVYQGTLVRLNWHSIPTENNGVGRGCSLSRPVGFFYYSWIAVIIEDTYSQTGCSLLTLLNYTSLTNASAILFLHDVGSSFDSPVTKASFPKSSLLVSSFFRRQKRGGNDLASASPLLISLPMDMFPDLPTQLAVASASSQVAVTGDIELFAEPPSTPAIAPTVAENTTDLSSSLLLLLIVCVLFLLLGILLVPARLGMCFWQRFCFLSLAGSAKSRRSRKLTAAMEKALKQLPVKCLNQVDPLISEGFDQCAICIEIFKPHDLIRSLPCRHMYHRACIDPWLLKHRSCPLCKQNILIACGLHVADEDINSCSASSSDVNSAFSVSTASYTSSFSTSLEGLLSLFNCHRCCHRHNHNHRRGRYRHHHHHNPFYGGFYHVQRPSSSLNEVSAPSGGRRVLGSASEHSSSSITTRSVPSDLFPTAMMASSALSKSARFAADEFDEEESQSVEISLWRRRQRSLVSYCSCCKGGGVRLNKEVPVERVPPPPPPPPLLPTRGIIRPTTPMCPLSVAHPSTMLFYHLPQSMAFTQIAIATKADLPSYEQATASTPILPPCPRQEVSRWNPQFATERGQQMDAGLPDPSLQQSHFGAKTNVVYTVLSTSAARMSVGIGVPPAPVLCSPGTKLPIFVDVNTPVVADTFEGQRQCLLPSCSSPPLIHTREPPPPAYSLATSATNEKPIGISLNPLRQAARLLAMHLLPPPVHKLQKPHRHYHISFFGDLKHCQQSRKSKSLLKPRPRGLQEISTPALATAGVIVSRRHPHHRRRGCQRTGLLAKTLELNHDGVIMPASAIAAKLSPVPSLYPLSLSSALRLSDRAPSPRCPSNLVSESSSEGTYNSPLRHTRVCSVRVTVEPQVQYHVERDASSCEALHSRILHDLGSDTSLPTPSTSTDIDCTAATIVPSPLRCRFSESAPAIGLLSSTFTSKISPSASSSSLPTL